MAKKIRIELKRPTIRALAKDPAMEAMLLRAAQEAARKAGPGFEARSQQGRNRARASVVSVTNEARRAEATDRALSKAIGSMATGKRGKK